MRKKNIAGMSMIEFVLVVPILILIVTGTVEYGLLFYNQNVISTASREGARYGIVKRSAGYATSAQIITYTKTFCNNNLISFSSSSTPVTVTTVQSANPQKAGDTLTVTVNYPYTGLVLFKLLQQGNQHNLTASTTMVYQ